MRKAFYGGSFDPFTIGHLFIVCQALQSYDEVIIGIGKNSEKVSKFSDDEKVEMIKKSLDDLVSMAKLYKRVAFILPSEMISAAELIEKDPDCIKIIVYDGLTVDTAIQNNAEALIRGIRTAADRNNEIALRDVNEALCELRGAVCPTIIFDTSETFAAHVSSSMVKKLMEKGEYIVAKSYVMPSVHDLISKVYLRDVYYKITGSVNSAYDYLCEKSERGFQRFSSIACDLNMLNVYRLHNRSHDMSSKIYDLAIFWSTLVGLEIVDENVHKLIGHLVGDFDRFITLCEATNFAVYSKKRKGADKDADTLSDICLNHLIYQKNHSVNFWQRWCVARADMMPEFEFLSCAKALCEKYIMDELLFKTDYFNGKYMVATVANMKREKSIIDILLKKYQTD